jgi:hypothetical protein
MALIEKKIIDQIMVDADNSVFVREATIVEQDDKEIVRTYHRYSLAKGQDISQQPLKVQSVCNAAWA